MGLKPTELYEMSLFHLADMLKAYARVEEEEFTVKMQMLSWQTSLLMNSTGNYKKKIKPSDLFDPENVKEPVKATKKQTVAEMQEELKRTFAGSF